MCSVTSVNGPTPGLCPTATMPRPTGCGWWMPPSSAWPATARPRRRSTTSPGRPGCRGPPIYRAFPGGRDEILAAVVDTEAARLFSALGLRLGAASDLTEALVAGIVEASSRIRNHSALAYMVAHEPEIVLGHLAFEDSARLLETAARFTAPFLARWLRPAEAGRVAEWATRIVLSYAISPSPQTDLCDPDQATRLVTTFVMPGVRALHRAATAPTFDITPFAPAPGRTAPATVENSRAIQGDS